jgi:hypothetical protein
MKTIQAPFPLFLDRRGDPLDAGQIYIGTVNTNAQTNPIAVYWDEAATQPAAQPLRTSMGYIVNGVTRARAYVNADDFSVLVKDKAGTVIDSVMSAEAEGGLRADLASTALGKGAEMIGLATSGATPAATVGFYLSLLQKKVMPNEFRFAGGAKGDGTTSDTAAFVACREYCRANNVAMVIPKGRYRLTSSFYFGTSGVGPYGGYSILGDGSNSTVLLLDFDASVGVDLNPGTGGYTAFALSSVGGFRVQVAAGRTITYPLKIQNAYNNDFHNIHIYCDATTVSSSFAGLRVSGAVYFNTFKNVWVEAYNGDPTTGKGFYVGNGRGDVGLDGANTSVNTFTNCRTRGFAVGFDTVLANNTIYQSCDAEVSTTGFRDLATYWSAYRDCWNEGSTNGLIVDESTYLNGDGSTHAAAPSAWTVVDGGSWGGPVVLNKCLSPRIRSYLNAITISASAEDVKWEHTGATTPTVTGASVDAVIDYRPTTPFVRNVKSLGSKRWCHQFPTTAGPAEIHHHSSGDNPLVSAYRSTGSGSNFSGYRIEAAAGGRLNFYTWATGGMSSETPVLGLSVDAGTAVFTPQNSATPSANGELVIQRDSNTQITIKLKGSDGVVRSVALTLA